MLDDRVVSVSSAEDMEPGWRPGPEILHHSSMVSGPFHVTPNRTIL